MALFDSFSNGLKEKIGKSPEWQSRGKSSAPKAPAGPFDDMEDDIPF